MLALIDAAKQNDFPAEIVSVLSNRADASGLALAASHGVATDVIAHRNFSSREEHDAALNAAIEASNPDFVCLAGYMRIMTAGLIERWKGRMINIHPSLLPAFPGINTHERAIKAGVSEHGCTVHFVTLGVDEGPIIAQAKVPVLDGDTAQTLASRVLAAEHKLYPAALRLVAEGKLTQDNRHNLSTPVSPDNGDLLPQTGQSITS